MLKISEFYIKAYPLNNPRHHTKYDVAFFISWIGKYRWLCLRSCNSVGAIEPIMYLFWDVCPDKMSFIYLFIITILSRHVVHLFRQSVLTPLLFYVAIKRVSRPLKLSVWVSELPTLLVWPYKLRPIYWTVYQVFWSDKPTVLPVCWSTLYVCWLVKVIFTAAQTVYFVSHLVGIFRCVDCVDITAGYLPVYNLIGYYWRGFLNPLLFIYAVLIVGFAVI